MYLNEFDYFLPESLIAQEPIQGRDTSRLLVLNKTTGTIEHRHFFDCIEYMNAGDVLVLNNTRVIPARLYGHKENTGAHVEIVLLKRTSESEWEALVRPGKRIQVGTKIIFGDGLLVAEAIGVTDVGGRMLKFYYEGIFEEILDRLGEMPLPPYISKKLTDRERYQTVYAKNPGSAAAPTAGLHFTPDLLNKIRDKGIQIVEVLLHVGLGTFRPVKTENITDHKMHSEYYEISAVAADTINRAKQAGNNIIAVGTTSARVLETTADEAGVLHSGSGWTDIFIYPGYQFKAVDQLITNFHLPKSTLLMLVSALAGKQKIMNAYAEAVRLEYRFFSFGDAMFIVNES